jgi:Xaa-Pro aminopeptidase
MGAWILVPELPGMGRRVDATTATRRRAIMARIGRGVVLIPAAHERDTETEYVQDNDFRQHNTFFYFTELETEDAWLLMSAPHWLGMDVHDVGDYTTPLAPGMVFTIEPGIYLQEEGLGVRIEDDVVVTATGAEWLSAGLPKKTDEIERMMRR